MTNGVSLRVPQAAVAVGNEGTILSVKAFKTTPPTPRASVGLFFFFLFFFAGVTHREAKKVEEE